MSMKINEKTFLVASDKKATAVQRFGEGMIEYLVVFLIIFFMFTLNLYQEEIQIEDNLFLKTELKIVKDRPGTDYTFLNKSDEEILNFSKITNSKLIETKDLANLILKSHKDNIAFVKDAKLEIVKFFNMDFYKISINYNTGMKSYIFLTKPSYEIYFFNSKEEDLNKVLILSNNPFKK